MYTEFPAAVPEIPVSDLTKAAAYYHDILGFNIDWGGEDGGIMGISKGNCRMFLTTEAFRKHYQNLDAFWYGSISIAWNRSMSSSRFGARAKRRSFPHPSPSLGACMSSQWRILTEIYFAFFMTLLLPNAKARNNIS
jgi:hypothetical protein